MSTLLLAKPRTKNLRIAAIKSNRVESIDVLRGIVMIVMALDHVRDYFHYDAFIYQPTDLSRTSVFLFFTRWITHFCAPVFVFLAGISAHLYGHNRTRKELSRYLLTRGLWLVFAELFLITLAWTFNPAYHIFHLQVIWAIGISMIVLSALIWLSNRMILLIGIVIIAGHNLLDNVHIPGNFLWAVLHDPGDFHFGPINFAVRYPVLPWIGIMALGYYLGNIYTPDYNPGSRRKILVLLGIGAVAVFFLLRFSNVYGDPQLWALQSRQGFTFLSLLNATKYPPSLLYTLMTIGPAMIFLGVAVRRTQREKPLNAFTEKIAVFGKVPFFYYIVHLYLIHLLALIGAAISGFSWSAMILDDRVNRIASLKGYGFTLTAVYLVWLSVVLLLYPCCKWFGEFKRSHQRRYRWLSYV